MRWMLVIAILGCSSSNKHDGAASPSSPSPPMPKIHLASRAGDVAVEVEIVSTPARIQRGLMFRQHLPPDHGMLFLMEQDKIWPFWMRNTLIPLDMIFIARDMTIAGIVENAEPRTDTLRQVDRPSLYVLEVNGGFCAAHEIAAGAKVQFERVTR